MAIEARASIGSPRPSATDGSGTRRRCGSWATSSTSRSRSGSSARRSGSRSGGRSSPGRSASSTGTVFMAFHAAQGPTLGLPQMIQSRAQFGYRGVIVPLFATLFTYLAFNVVDQILLADGLEGAFGWNGQVVALVCALGAAAAGDLRPRLRAPDLPHPALHLAAADGRAHRRRDRRRGGRRRGGQGLLHLDRVHGAVLRGGGVQHHLRAVRVATTRATCRARRRTARSSPPSSSARRGRAIWLIALGAWLAVSLGADRRARRPP